MRPTINSKTFEKIFINNSLLLAQMITRLTREKTDKYYNNVTSDKNNKDNKKYLITMPKDNIIKITNTTNNESIIIDIKKEA